MFETFPKSGQTTHKNFGVEKPKPEFVPSRREPEYSQEGSSIRYGRKLAPKSNYKTKSKSASFAKGGGSALVSASYPSKSHGFSGTKGQFSLGPVRTKTQKEA